MSASVGQPAGAASGSPTTCPGCSQASRDPVTCEWCGRSLGDQPAPAPSGPMSRHGQWRRRLWAAVGCLLAMGVLAGLPRFRPWLPLGAPAEARAAFASGTRYYIEGVRFPLPGADVRGRRATTYEERGELRLWWRGRPPRGRLTLALEYDDPRCGTAISFTEVTPPRVPGGACYFSMHRAGVQESGDDALLFWTYLGEWPMTFYVTDASKLPPDNLMPPERIRSNRATILAHLH